MKRLSFLLLLLAGCAVAEPPPPEIASGFAPKALTVAERAMVVTAHPLATEAGLAMLHQGGNAVDAAVAAQLVLTLVEPQSSGLGGGGFLLFHDQAAGRITTYDGRETAPAAARADDLLGPDGQPLPFKAAAASGRSVGVPGTPLLLETVHRQHGRLPWPNLFAPAIRLAEDGFAVTPRLSASIAASEVLKNDPAAKGHFYQADGQPKPAGTMLRNPALAATLRLMAEQGSAPFYRGRLAEQIVAAARSGPGPQSRLQLSDLAAYRIVQRPPVCVSYRAHAVCGMGPPSSGGIAVGQMLGILGHTAIAELPAASVQTIHLQTQAARLAFADRNRHLGDPAFTKVDPTALLAPAYLAERAARINPRRDLGVVPPGALPGYVEAGTSHLSIVDPFGNAVSFTTTIESAFGSGRMVGGFLLNNELTDFDLAPAADGRPAANRIEGGKRPRSSMAPTIVHGPDGHLRFVTGTPGGAHIIGWTAQSLIALIDHDLDPQAAANLPHAANTNGEVTTAETEALADGLRALGHKVQVGAQTSGLSIVKVARGRLEGGADPRRENAAAGF